MLWISAPSLAGLLPWQAVGCGVARASLLLNLPLRAVPSASRARLVPDRTVTGGLTVLPVKQVGSPAQPATRVGLSSAAASGPTSVADGPAFHAGVDTWS